jgi:hypothetical protein
MTTLRDKVCIENRLNTKEAWLKNNPELDESVFEAIKENSRVFKYKDVKEAVLEDEKQLKFMEQELLKLFDNDWKILIQSIINDYKQDKEEIIGNFEEEK